MTQRILLTWSSILLLSSTALSQEKDSHFFKDLEASFTYTADVFANASGGLETGIRYFDNIDVEVGFNAVGLDFYFYGLGNQGGSISELAGDIQTISNIETDNAWRVYEVWFEKQMPHIRTSFLAGLYDLNSEFDVVNTSQLFLNSSHGIGPDFSSSGITGPSIFPLTSLSARLKIVPAKGLTVKAAILDAVPSDPLNTTGTKVKIRNSEGFLLVSEISLSRMGDNSLPLNRGINEKTPFRFVIGGWRYSEKRMGWAGNMESDHGIYAIFEAKVFSEHEDSQEGLSAFLRTGFTNRDINRYNYYWGTGLSYTGLFANRDTDQLGLAFSMPVNSDEFLKAAESSGDIYTSSEQIIELTYLFNVSEIVSFQFDSQYVLNPNQAPDIDNALVIGLRTSFSF